MTLTIHCELVKLTGDLFMKKLLFILALAVSIFPTDSVSAKSSSSSYKCCKKTQCLVKHIDSELSECCQEIEAKLNIIDEEVKHVDSELSECCEEIQAKLDTIDDKVNTINSKLSCTNVIYAKDVPFIIPTAGEWCLGEDIVYNPVDQKPAIRIPGNLSNVTLDLNGKTLSQGGSKAIHGIDGISADAGVTNIIIRNGTVRDFSLHGVVVGGLSATPITTEIEINNIRALNNGVQLSTVNSGFAGIGGLALLTATDVKVLNCDLNQNFMSGLITQTVTKLTVENTHCDDNSWAKQTPTSNAITYACQLGGTTNIATFRNCTFNRNSGVSFVNGVFNVGGNLNDTIFENCKSNENNTLISDPTLLPQSNQIFVAGYAIDAGTNVIFKNCQANNGSMTVTVPNLQLDQCFISGFEFGPRFGDGVRNFDFIDCEASGNKVINNTGVSFAIIAQGFRGFTGTTFNRPGITNAAFIGCQSHGSNITHNPLPATFRARSLVGGFSLSHEGNITFEDCVSTGHNQNARNATNAQGNIIEFSLASGFDVRFTNLDIDARPGNGPVMFRRCTASGNFDTISGVAAGFSTREPIVNPPAPPAPFSASFVFENCISERNTSVSGISAGFDIFDLQSSKVANCYAETNAIGILVSETTAGRCIMNVFTNNMVSSNTQFGIQDTTSALSNSYFTNRAQQNGVTQPGGAAANNYSPSTLFPVAICGAPCVSANLIPIRSWVLPNAPCPYDTNCVLGEVLDNISIS